MAKPVDGSSALDLLLLPPDKKVKVGAMTRATDALNYFGKQGSQREEGFL